MVSFAPAFPRPFRAPIPRTPSARPFRQALRVPLRTPSALPFHPPDAPPEGLPPAGPSAVAARAAAPAAATPAAVERDARKAPPGFNQLNTSSISSGGSTIDASVVPIVSDTRLRSPMAAASLPLF